jgi:hypothetical protein
MLAKTWAMLLAFATLAAWAVWVALGHASWPQWYMGAFPAALAMGGIGFAIGHILDHPQRPMQIRTRQASKTAVIKPADPIEENASTLPE